MKAEHNKQLMLELHNSYFDTVFVKWRALIRLELYRKVIPLSER
jgi:hypothetical protein